MQQKRKKLNKPTSGLKERKMHHQIKMIQLMRNTEKLMFAFAFVKEEAVDFCCAIS